MKFPNSTNKIIFFILFFLNIFSAKAQEPKIIKIEELKTLMQKTDEIYVLNFWATWCKPCVAEIAHFEKLASEYQSKRVKVIFVSLDFKKNFENVKRFADEKNIKSPIYLLDEPDYDSWINQVNNSWSGAIPATLIFSEKRKEFFEQSFDYQVLVEKITLF